MVEELQGGCVIKVLSLVVVRQSWEILAHTVRVGVMLRQCNGGGRSYNDCWLPRVAIAECMCSLLLGPLSRLGFLSNLQKACSKYSEFIESLISRTVVIGQFQEGVVPGFVLVSYMVKKTLNRMHTFFGMNCGYRSL